MTGTRPVMTVGEWSADRGQIAARSPKSTPLGQTGHVARAMQDANDHQLFGVREVVDRVAPVERHAKAGGDVISRGTCIRKVPNRLKRGLHGADEPGRYALRGFRRDVGPYLGEVRFRRLG